MNIEEKQEFAVMKNEITHIKTDVTEIKTMLKDHLDWEEDKYLQLESKYASKWVEKAILGIIISVAAGVLVLLIQAL